MRNLLASTDLNYVRNYASESAATTAIEKQLKSVVDSHVNADVNHYALDSVFYVIAIKGDRFVPICILSQQQLGGMHCIVGTGTKGFKIIQR